MVLTPRFGLLLFLLSCSVQALSTDFFHQPEVKGHAFDSRIRTPFQDDAGFIWFSSKNTIWRFDGYQVVNISELYPTDHIDLSQSRFFYQDQSGTFWIGTHNGHLYTVTDRIEAVQIDADGTTSYAAITETADGVWIATLNELVSIDANQTQGFPYPENFSNSLINSVVADGSFIYVVTSTQLLQFSIVEQQFETVAFSTDNKPPNLRSLSQVNDTLWLSTDRGVYRKTGHGAWQPYLPDVLNMRIRSVTEDADHVWVATILKGLYRISKINGSIKQDVHNPDRPGSIASDELTDIMVDANGLIWTFHFSGMIDYLDLNQSTTGLNFELADHSCYQNQVVYDFADDAENLWFLLQNGILKLNKTNGDCQLINALEGQAGNAFENRIPFSAAHGSNNLWIGTSDGILQLNPQGELRLTHPEVLNVAQLNHLGNNQLLAATDDGIFLVDTTNQQSIQLTNDAAFKNIKFNDILTTETQTSFFAASDGLYHSDSLAVGNIKKLNLTTEPGWVNSLLQYQNQLWLATQSNGLIILDHQLAVVKQIELNNAQNAPVSINALLEDNKQHVWAATNNGLYQFDQSLDVLHHYDHSNGLQGLRFNAGAAYRATDGKLFFGGRNGFNSFYPEQLKRNSTPPSMVLTRLSRFNQTVKVNDDQGEFLLTADINDLSNLTLSHRDYVIELEFSALSFAHADKNQYAYKLGGFETDWNHVGADDRTVTYTTLPSGTYEFQVMGSNSDGVWSRDNKSLTIKVLPAPWFSWWALTLYAVLFLFLLYAYIQRKIQSNQRIAAILRAEVAEKTKELNIQKQTVESLLVKKNELFANVSHEFRTPLTLILGPIKDLLAKQVDPDDINSLNLIKRNANRLLSLVEQLLQIARVANFQEIKTTPQQTAGQINALVQSFQLMADNKKVDLQLLQNDPCTIDVTDQFIDVVLGNLISNAIKYTQSGGTVTIQALATDSHFTLSVQDTGAGLTAAQQQDIFKRFRRLKSHQSIEGIGIGLAVVEEVVKINNGEIKVSSTLGEGSQFTVRVPVSAARVTDEKTAISSLVTQLRSEPMQTSFNDVTKQTFSDDSNLNTVLVIEDNPDMRQHIASIIKPHYNCLTASDGAQGVALAVEHIPDLIISDVMMPELDGFAVSRIIRSDQRTSHIPLMLLTALNDKTSRIKGWREHVDAYMTKPFDQEELLIQVENMLTIRDILSQKAASEISQESKNSVLSKTDQQFIDKLMDVIEADFSDPLLNRKKVAQKMAVSERQLQRKLKALINQNPSDLIREVRLKHAKLLLKDGYQVSTIADDCGFNSLSYFSQCFKAQYGLTPKKYQQQHKQ